MSQTKRELQIQKWEKLSAIPLGILALSFLGLWAFQVLGNLSTATWNLVEAFTIAIWAIFVIDFVVRLTFHEDKRHFLRNNVIEILALAVPAFRAFRMLRVITAVGILTRVAQSFQARVNLYVAIVLPMLVFSGSLGVLEAEAGAPNATIKTFADATWWSIETVFTIGYGDFTPVTFEGRAIAVILMLTGIAMISIVTINMAAYILRHADVNILRLRK
jgi:voltage-gated potassium channel